MSVVAAGGGPAVARLRPWWRVGIGAIAYLVASAVGAVLVRPAHPAIGAGSLGLALVAGVVAAVTMGPLGRRLRFATGWRVGVLVVLAYLLLTATNEVEAVLFIKGSSPLVLVAGVVQALGIGVPAGVLWAPEDSSGRVGAVLRRVLASRPWWSWAWRLVLASVLWVPVYLVFAAADAPFVHIYYSEKGTSFTVPGNGVLFGAELLRGVLHAVVLGALVALVGGGRLRGWLWAALAFAALNAWVPLVQRSDWPWFLRAANAVEITCDAVVYGAIVAALLVRRRVRDHGGDG
jgi:hypothetical protein